MVTGNNKGHKYEKQILEELNVKEILCIEDLTKIVISLIKPNILLNAVIPATVLTAEISLE